MKILGHIPSAGGPLGGGDVSFQEICRELAARGHDVIVIADRGRNEERQGVQVKAECSPPEVMRLYKWADLLLTQRRSALQPLREFNTRHQRRKRKYRRLVRVFFARNAGQPVKYGYSREDLDLVVFNARWACRATHWYGQAAVFPPPVYPDRYRTLPGDHVVQMNLSELKGGRFFWEIVRLLPDRQFLAVKGKEPDQVIPEVVPNNCTLIENTPNVRDEVYSRAKIILMPSQGVDPQHKWVAKGTPGYKKTESWGRVPIEAAASGIPTIAFPTPGLRESLQNAATFLEFDSRQWAEEICRLLDDPDYYAHCSSLALERSRELDPAPAFDTLEHTLRQLVEYKQRRLARHPKALGKRLLRKIGLV